MRLALTALFMVLPLAACNEPAPPKPVEHLVVESALIRLPAADGRPAAGYFTIRGGKSGDRLISIASAAATTIELHETRMSGGMMSMRPLTGIDVPAHGTVRFEPGGNHAMLFGVDPEIKPGAPVTLTFTFQEAGDVDVKAATIAAGAAMPDEAGDHSGH